LLLRPEILCFVLPYGFGRMIETGFKRTNNSQGLCLNANWPH
jgi:hypothetical protein